MEHFRSFDNIYVNHMGGLDTLSKAISAGPKRWKGEVLVVHGTSPLELGYRSPYQWCHQMAKSHTDLRRTTSVDDLITSSGDFRVLVPPRRGPNISFVGFYYQRMTGCPFLFLATRSSASLWPLDGSPAFSFESISQVDTCRAVRGSPVQSEQIFSRQSVAEYRHHFDLRVMMGTTGVADYVLSSLYRERPSLLLGLRDD